MIGFGVFRNNTNEELWADTFGGGESVLHPQFYFNGFLIENYFCPEDSCEQHVLRILRSAKERIYFLTFSFTSDKIGEEIIKNYYYGVDVKGVFEKRWAGSEFSEFNKMKDLGGNVKLDNNPKIMHHKVFLVDDVVVFGSYNPTSSWDKRNDENILIIHDKDVVEKFVGEFERIWNL